MPIKKLDGFKKVLEIGLGVSAVLLLTFFVLVSHDPKAIEVRSDSPSKKTMAEIEGLSTFEEQIADLTKPEEEPVEGASQESKEEVALISENSADASTGQENQENQEEQETAAQKTEDVPEVPRADLTIGVVADAHAGQENGWSKLNSFAWRMANYEQPDIIVDLGDLIESRYQYKDVSRDSAIADYRKASYLTSRYPVYHTIGNHEILSMSKEDLQGLMGRKNYYSASVKGYNIIVLDANYKVDKTSIEKPEGDNAKIYTGTLPDKQRDWLKSKLKNNDRNLIFIHHPPYNLTNNSTVEDIIQDNKKRIILIANGHKHPSTLEKSYFGGVKNYDIPSLHYQRMYAIIKINGEDVKIVGRGL